MALGQSFRLSGFSGVNNVQRPELARKGDLQVGLNIDVDDSGGCRMRPGSELVYPGATHSIASDGVDILFRKDGDLLRLNPTARTAEVLASGFTDGLRMSWLHLNDTLYYGDGVVKGKYADRRIQSCGAAVPDAPALTAASGNLISGNYQVVYTYIRNDGQESGASPDARFDVSGGGLQVTVSPSADPEVSGIAVYCSTADGEQLYRQAVTPNQAGSVTISDRIAVGESLLCTTLDFYPPPEPELLDFYRGRVYGAAGPWFWHNDPWRHELCAPDHNLSLLSGDVTMLIALENGIWLGTTRGTYFLAGKDPHENGGFQIRGRQISYPPLRSAVRVDGSKFNPMLRLAKGQVAVWPTSEGVFVGDSEGVAINLTGSHWVAPSGIEGTGFVNEDPAGPQYLFGILGTPGQGSGNVRVTINP